MNKTIHKPEYKKTKIGYIPKDWEVKSIADVFNFYSTNSFSRSMMSPKGEIFNIHYGDIHTKYANVILDFEKYLDLIPRVKKTTKINSNTQKVLEGDLIIADASEDYEGLGNCIEVKNIGNKEVLAGLHCFHLRDEENLTAPGYRGYLIKHPNVITQLKRIATGISVLGLSKGNFSKVLIPLPPLPEQNKISQILSTWDRAIELTQKMIEKKELLKKGLMQQLLTGKVRVICPETGKPFEGDWERKKIKEIAKEIKLINKDSEVTLVFSCTKYDGLVESLKYFGRRVYSENLSNYKVVPKGCFAYATNHIEEGSIGFQSHHNLGLVSPMYTVLKTNSTVHDPYFYMVLKSPRLIYEYQSRSIGSVNRRGGLRWREFSKIPINLPSLQEQEVIASQLLTNNLHIKNLKKYLNCLKTQKKGLMQQLLTGRKRVKVEVNYNQNNSNGK
jgi:type I restriction enzyme, S subunit